MESPNVFLLSMEIRGIKNLEKTVKLNFYNETFTNKFDPSKYRIKGIYGENGVGKSAIMSSVYFYKELMTNSNFLGLTFNDERINYLLNKKSNKLSFSFEFIFHTDNRTNIYKHSIELIKNKKNHFEISKEYAKVRTPKTSYKDIYTVENGELKFAKESEDNRIIIDKTKNTLKNTSLICSIVSNDEINYNISSENELKDLYYSALSLYVYINTHDKHTNFLTRKYLETTNESVQNIIPLISLNYLTCEDRSVIRYDQIKKYEQIINDLYKFIKIYKPDLKRIEIDKKPDRDGISCGLIFCYEGYSIYGEFESNGIKKLVELFLAIKAVSNGLIVFIDELDANIHDYYLCRLLEYVAEYTEGQLCFTSHNLGPMEVLKEYKKSIDFLSRDGEIVPWIKNGNYNVANQYKEGKIRKFPFNIDSFDFIKVFGNEEE